MRRTVRVGLTIATVFLVIAATSVTWVWWELHAPHGVAMEGGVVVDLPRGMDAGSMLERLHDAGVVRNPRLIRAWLVLRGGGSDLQAGEYAFQEPLSALEVVDKLTRGDVLLHPITLPEGFDLEETAARLAAEGFGDPSDLLSVFRKPEIVSDIDPDAEDLEGYLFPDTYFLPRGETPERIVRTMVERFEAAIGPDYVADAEAVGLTLREAVTLASMIEKETSVPEERWRISRVFHNRLRGRMKLQCDPTVIYALEREGREVGRLSYADLEYDSPWNTYRVYGLPPGPICSPGQDSLDAAVRPTEGDELYFVASPEGGHRFSSSLQAHLEAVRQWRLHQRSLQ
jgi:UPF0755 protein